MKILANGIYKMENPKEKNNGYDRIKEKKEWQKKITPIRKLCVKSIK